MWLVGEPRNTRQRPPVRLGRFETEVLTQPGNQRVLTKLSTKWIDRLRERQPMRELI